jgi:peptidoglycan/LPS O-acetylase OafA/YrhL
MKRLLDGKSIGECLDEHRGWTNGFDYLRIILASCVVGWHTLFSSYGSLAELPVLASWSRSLIIMILPMFFAMGGFLVTASLLRSRSVTEYLLLRVLRFWPGLLAVIAVSALVVGPLVTTDSLKTYFFQTEFLDYWLTAFGEIHYELPGVFRENPAVGIVNISLWTIPWEFSCCVALCGLIIFKNLQRPRVLIAIAIGLSIFIPLLAFFTHTTFSLFERPPGHLLVLCFIPGVLFYFFRYSIPVRFDLFVFALLVSLLLLSKAKTSYLAPFFIAYATMYLGVLHPPKFGIMKTGDYSYGIYLFGFLVQQIAVDLLPACRIWWVNGLVSLPVATIFAMMSWHLIESPILKRKKALLSTLEIALRGSVLSKINSKQIESGA